MPAPEDLPFPHVNQVWLIERYVTALDGTPTSAVAALGVTNLPATAPPPHASPPWSATTGASSRCIDVLTARVLRRSAQNGRLRALITLGWRCCGRALGGEPVGCGRAGRGADRAVVPTRTPVLPEDRSWTASVRRSGARVARPAYLLACGSYPLVLFLAFALSR